MIASFFGKSKAPGEEEKDVKELEVPVGQVSRRTSRVAADHVLRLTHWASTSSIRLPRDRAESNMRLSMSDFFYETMLSLTVVQHRSGTWIGRRRLQDLNSRQRKDVASRFSAGRLEEW